MFAHTPRQDDRMVINLFYRHEWMFTFKDRYFGTSYFVSSQK
jgi:hypothetical protein